MHICSDDHGNPKKFCHGRSVGAAEMGDCAGLPRAPMNGPKFHSPRTSCSTCCAGRAGPGRPQAGCTKFNTAGLVRCRPRDFRPQTCSGVLRQPAWAAHTVRWAAGRAPCARPGPRVRGQHLSFAPLVGPAQVDSCPPDRQSTEHRAIGFRHPYRTWWSARKDPLPTRLDGGWMIGAMRSRPSAAHRDTPGISDPGQETVCLGPGRGLDRPPYLAVGHRCSHIGAVTMRRSRPPIPGLPSQ